MTPPTIELDVGPGRSALKSRLHRRSKPDDVAVGGGSCAFVLPPSVPSREPAGGAVLGEIVETHVLDQQAARRLDQAVDLPGIAAVSSGPAVVLHAHVHRLVEGRRFRLQEFSLRRGGNLRERDRWAPMTPASALRIVLAWDDDSGQMSTKDRISFAGGGPPTCATWLW